MHINRENSQYKGGLTGLKRMGFEFVFFIDIYKYSCLGLLLLLYI